MPNTEIARTLLAARRGDGPAPVPAIADEAQAYAIQHLVMAELGPIGGWKVGAARPNAPPSCAPMPASGLVANSHVFDSTAFTQREVESEICFRLGTDLPARKSPYRRDEVIAAIASCHAGIEVLQSRYAGPVFASGDEGAPLALLADFIQTGGYVLGGVIADWQHIDFAAMRVSQSITGGPTRHSGGNPAGDMIRLIEWLANHGAVWAGGLAAGQVITCGSWTGKTRVEAEDAQVMTAFTGAPVVRAGFRPAAPRM